MWLLVLSMQTCGVSIPFTEFSRGHFVVVCNEVHDGGIPGGHLVREALCLPTAELQSYNLV